MSTEEGFKSFSWLWNSLLVVLCIISEARLADSVIVDQQTGGCGGSFVGSVGNFTSPGYPNNYAENLQCQYNITVDSNSRIHIDFIYIEIEAGDGCLYDSLLFRDGLDPSSPVLAKICHPHPVTIKSSGSSVSVLFSSDSTIGFRGFHLTWRAVPKVPLLRPDGMSITSPWIGIATPQDLVQIDSGISEYLWAVDKAANVYVYGNGHWDLVSGGMSTVTSGEAVLATSKDGAMWYRQGVSMGSPKGQSWQRASINTPMRKVESGRVGVVIAIDSKGTVYQLQMSYNGPTGVLLKLYDANPNDPLVDVSCGSYACWFVSKNGALFMAESIQSYFVGDASRERVIFRQISTPTNIKQVAAAFDGSVWAITMAGDVYKRKGISMLLPDGVSWAKIANVNLKMITSGFLGVYGVTKSNIIITMEDMKCGGIITAKKGMFTSPNYPRIYPADLTCLWILRIPGATSISVRFINPTGLGKSSVCDKDFLVTYQDGRYPSNTEPVIECGTKIADKNFKGNEAWFEFNSGNDAVRNLGFSAVFDASFVVKTTSRPTTGTKTSSTQASTKPSTRATSTGSTTPKITMSSYNGSKFNVSKSTLSSTRRAVITSEIKDKQVFNKTTTKPDMTSTSMDQTQIDVMVSDKKTDAKNMTQDLNDNLKTMSTLPSSKGTDMPIMTSTHSPPVRTMGSSKEHIASTAPKDMTTVKTSAPSTAHSTTRSAMGHTTKEMLPDIGKDAGSETSTESDLLPPPVIITDTSTAAPRIPSTLPNTEAIMPPKPAITQRTSPKQQTPTTDSAMPPLPTNLARTDKPTANPRRPPVPTNIARTTPGAQIPSTDSGRPLILTPDAQGPDRSTADPRRPPLPTNPYTDPVRPPIPATSDQKLPPVDTSARPDMKTPSMGGTKVPAGWERVTPNVPLSQIVTGFSNRAWGLDNDGKAFVQINDAWRQVGDNKYRSFAVGQDAVWATVKSDGDVHYRQGMTKGNPYGSSWVKVQSPGMKKVILGPRNEVFAISRDGVLYRRSGVTYLVPYGSKWVDTGKRVVDATIGSFGILVIDLTGRLQFAEIKMDENMKFSESDWRTADGPQLREINAGHGSSLWGIQANDGVVVERQGIEALYPLGKSWKLHEGKTITVNPGMFDVYRTLSDGTIVKRNGDKCGGIISLMKGNIKTPNYPSNYPANAYCLWVVKVPEAKKIEVKVQDSELEEDRYCRLDRMIIFIKMSDEPIYKCGKMAQNKTIIGDNFMVEFKSNGFSEKKGFNLQYNSYFKKDLMSASTQKPATTMPKKDCDIVCTTDYNPICGSDGKTYANECVMKAESCATNNTITMKSKGECQDCPKACTADYNPVCGSDDKTYANECVMKAESCFTKKSITLKSKGECKDCSMKCRSDYDPVCGSDDETYDNECIMKVQSCKTKKNIFIKSRGSCKVCSIKCPTDFTPVCGSNDKTYANECILKAESCLQRKVISVKSKGVCPEMKAPSGWEFVKPFMKMSMVASGLNDNLWALDSSGRPHVYMNMEWKQVQPGTYKSLAVDDRGLWGIRNDGMLSYRKGVTDQNPMGESWMTVDGRNMRKIITGSMNEVLAIRDDGTLLTISGVSADSPTGTSSALLGKKVKDASIGSYGIWIIDDAGKLQFARTFPDADLSRSFLRWKDVDGELKAISAGFGGSLWGILKNGTAVKRENVNSGRPTGTRWMAHDGMTSSVSPGVYRVYRTLSDGTVVKRIDSTCGGILTSMSGTIQTPNFPSLYPRNSNCLWLIKVQKVDQIEVKYGNFELEEDQYCRADRMVTMAPRIYRPPRECGTRVQNKKIASNIMMIEFISNDRVEKRGFKASYIASVIPETTTKAATTTTMMKPTTTTMPTEPLPRYDVKLNPKSTHCSQQRME